MMKKNSCAENISPYIMAAVWWARLRGKLLYVCIMHECLWLFLLFMSACMSEYVHVVVLQHHSLEGSSLRCETQRSLSPRSKSNVKHDKQRWKTLRGTTTSALLHISVINVIVYIRHLILLCCCVIMPWIACLCVSLNKFKLFLHCFALCGWVTQSDRHSCKGVSGCLRLWEAGGEGC